MKAKANVPVEVEVHMQVIRADGSKGPEQTAVWKRRHWLIRLLKGDK